MGNLFLQHVNLWWTGRFCKHCCYNFVWKLFNNMHCTVHSIQIFVIWRSVLLETAYVLPDEAVGIKTFGKIFVIMDFVIILMKVFFRDFIYNIYFWFKYFLNNFWNSNWLTLHFNLFENKSIWNKTQNWRTY